MLRLHRVIGTAGFSLAIIIAAGSSASAQIKIGAVLSVAHVPTAAHATASLHYRDNAPGQ